MSLNRKDLFSLEGKTVVLTGASGFLGKTMAETLLENGAKLIAFGRSERLLSAVESWQNKFGKNRIVGVRVDMYDLEKLSEALQALALNESHIDVLINNAHEMGLNTGFNTQEGMLETASFDQLQRNLMGGVFWPALMVQKLAERLKSSKASIINISTMYGIVSPSPKLYEGTASFNPPGYSAAKAAMLAFTRYVASFWGEHGVRSNALLPGPFSNTTSEGENSVKENDPFIGRLNYRTCLNRIGRPKELAGALLYLASDASSFTTGQAFSIDGGWTII